MPGGRIISPDNPLGPESPGAGIAGPLPGYQTIHDITQGAKDVAGAVVFLTDPQNWLRLGEAIAGGVLILVGILVLVWHTPAAQEAKDVAGPLAGAAAAVAA